MRNDMHKITSDGRYQKTELKIQQTINRLNLLIEPSNKLRIQEFCKEAGMSRAAFYRHYETLDEAIASYRGRAGEDFEEFCANFIKTDRSIEVNFYLIFCYFRRNREFYRALFERRRFDDAEPVLKKIREICIRNWIKQNPQIPESCQDQLFFLFSFEFLKELAYWFRFENCATRCEDYHVERLCLAVRALPRRLYLLPGAETVGA